MTCEKIFHLRGSPAEYLPQAALSLSVCLAPNNIVIPCSLAKLSHCRAIRIGIIPWPASDERNAGHRVVTGPKNNDKKIKWLIEPIDILALEGMLPLPREAPI